MSDNEQETIIEATESSSEEAPVEKPKKPKRNYVMTPARQESVNKMIEIRKKRAEEARKAREAKKIKEKQQKLRIQKQELKLKEVKLNPESSKIQITNEILSDDTDSDDSVEYVVTKRKKNRATKKSTETDKKHVKSIVETESHSSPVNYNNEFEVIEPNNFFFL